MYNYTTHLDKRTLMSLFPTDGKCGRAVRSGKSRHKQNSIRQNFGIAAWRRAAAEYLKKGQFIHLPKRGTPEHVAMRLRQKELIPVVRREIEAQLAKEGIEHRVVRAARNKRLLERAELTQQQDDMEQAPVVLERSWSPQNPVLADGETASGSGDSSDVTLDDSESYEDWL